MNPEIFRALDNYFDQITLIILGIYFYFNASTKIPTMIINQKYLQAIGTTIITFMISWEMGLFITGYTIYALAKHKDHKATN